MTGAVTQAIYRLRPSPRLDEFAWLRAAGNAVAGAITLVFCLAVLSLTSGLLSPAQALEAIQVKPEADRIEITNKSDYYRDQGDKLQVDTVPGRDGLSARIVIRAEASQTNPNWLVFALRNDSKETLERWLVAARYNIVGSGAVWPTLDSRRIEAVTPSLGVIPDRVQNDRKDIFRLTLPPGKTITFVAELATDKPTRFYLWKPLGFTQKNRDVRLFDGILLGIVGLLGIFLTAIFAANHKAIFPSAALMAWCVLAYLCVEFGFWHKLFQLHAADNAMYRAASESAVAASLVIFLFAFLRINIWHGFARMLFGLWIAGQLALVFAAVLDPRLAATFARLSFVAIGGLGGLLILFLALRGQDRALSLIPTWLLFGVWLFGMSMALTGKLSGDVVVHALTAGLVLFVLLIGFTVTQFAFRAAEPLYGAAPNQMQLRSLAIDGSGSAVWEWTARRDEIKVSPVVEALLGLREGELSDSVDNFLTHLHPADRERFRLCLTSAKETASEFLGVDFRMRHVDNSYRWFELEAATVPGVERKSLRCVGLIRDITESRRAQERLMHDAVHDSLTGLPNRELFLDRLGVAMTRVASEPHVRPSVLFIDIDKFKSINSSFGLIVGDSLLLTVARRLAHHIHGQDTLARVGGDQFAVLLLGDRPAVQMKSFADEIRHALSAPINIAGQEIVLTVSMGLALHDGGQTHGLDLLREAEIAMYRAKSSGTDQVRVFDVDMSNDKDERIAIESGLRRAIDNNELKMFYQPIIHLPTEELAGFEALVRWQHPKLGLINPAHFIPVAEETDLIVKLGSFGLITAAASASRWHKELPRTEDHLFVSVNVSSRQLFRHDLIQELRNIIGQSIVPPGSLRLEVTETLVMENPEQAMRMLCLLKEAGAGLSLDDFGTGYSSLAYLQRFPFDTIKIDQALVQGSGEDGPEAVIVRSIVALAHELDKKVVAEGVETPSDVGFLRALGCGYAQGYYYGEAMSEREVIKLLRTIRKSERRNTASTLFRTKPKKKTGKQGVEDAETISAATAKGTAQPVSAPAVKRRTVQNIAGLGEKPVTTQPAAMTKGAPGQDAASVATSAAQSAAAAATAAAAPNGAANGAGANANNQPATTSTGTAASPTAAPSGTHGAQGAQGAQPPNGAAAQPRVPQKPSPATTQPRPPQTADDASQLAALQSRPRQETTIPAPAQATATDRGQLSQRTDTQGKPAQNKPAADHAGDGGTARDEKFAKSNPNANANTNAPASAAGEAVGDPARAAESTAGRPEHLRANGQAEATKTQQTDFASSAMAAVESLRRIEPTVPSQPLQKPKPTSDAASDDVAAQMNAAMETLSKGVGAGADKAAASTSASEASKTPSASAPRAAQTNGDASAAPKLRANETTAVEPPTPSSPVPPSRPSPPAEKPPPGAPKAAAPPRRAPVRDQHQNKQATKAPVRPAAPAAPPATASDFKTLPPGIAASLARLAGGTAPPATPAPPNNGTAATASQGNGNASTPSAATGRAAATPEKASKPQPKPATEPSAPKTPPPLPQKDAAG